MRLRTSLPIEFLKNDVFYSHLSDGQMEGKRQEMEENLKILICDNLL